MDSILNNLLYNLDSYTSYTSTETSSSSSFEDELASELQNLLASTDSDFLEEVQETERRDIAWESLLATVDSQIQRTAQRLEEQEEQQLEDWIDNQLFTREFYLKRDIEQLALGCGDSALI